MRFFILVSALLFSVCGFSQNFYLFIGTYTTNKGDSKGIYVYRFDASTGNAEPVSTMQTDNPSYLALADGGKFLYAANETGGTQPGGISAFSFDKMTGRLSFLNKQEGGGDGPCFVSVDSKRRWVMLANYGGGSLSVLPIRSDGGVGKLAQLIQHSGHGLIPDRQERPHVHTVVFTPDEQYVLATDLGLDKISVYRFNPGAAQPLSPAADSAVNTQAGTGPRHLAFYPGKPYLYLMEEMGGAVDAFHYNKGRLKAFQRISSHPEGYTGGIGSADIHTTPNGKFLYATNRGDANSIAMYSTDPASGKLTLLGFQSTMGKNPRNFMIDPTGHFLLVANQNTNNIVIFRIDPSTGLLTPTGKSLEIPTPVCLKMTPVSK